MAQRFLVPNQGPIASMMAPPTLSLAPELPEDFGMSDELEFFRMDDSGTVQEDDHIDTLEFLEVDVDQAQVRYTQLSCRKILTVC
jgi:hypothetical protein